MTNNQNSCSNNEEYSFSYFENMPLLNDKNIAKFQSLTEDQPEVLREIMYSFIEESSVLIKDIESCIDDGQFNKFEEYVHAFKGLAATIGATRLLEISKYMDSNNKQKNFEVARKFFPLLKSTYYELEDVLKEKFFLNDQK